MQDMTEMEVYKKEAMELGEKVCTLEKILKDKEKSNISLK
jgi:hypothetical protein